MRLKELLKLANEHNQEDVDSLLRMLWDKSVSSNEPTTIIDSSPNSKREELVRVAASQIGEGAKDDGKMYFPGTVAFYPKTNKKIKWCGIFALWALHQVGLATGYKWKFDGTSFLSGLKTTNDPKPGDFGYKNKENHHNIIEKVDGDQIRSINGNGTNGVVSRDVSPKSSYAAFYSLDNFI
jgi:hypothetical protein